MAVQVSANREHLPSNKAISAVSFSGRLYTILQRDIRWCFILKVVKVVVTYIPVKGLFEQEKL